MNEFTQIEIDQIPKHVRRVLEQFEYDPDIKSNHIAITTHKTRVVAVGRNVYHKTHTVQAKYAELVGLECKHFLHAEVASLVKSRGKIDSIYVFRIGKRGQLMYSKPCPICQMAIEEAGITCFHS